MHAYAFNVGRKWFVRIQTPKGFYADLHAEFATYDDAIRHAYHLGYIPVPESDARLLTERKDVH